MSCPKLTKPEMIIAVIGAILALLLGYQEACAETFRGYVLDVIDGDTVKVLQPAPSLKGCPGIHTVRLQGIDAPEKAQPYGKAARRFVARLLYGRKVWVTLGSADRYERRIGKVCWSKTSPYRCIGYQLVRKGYAWHYRAYSSEERLNRAELKARSEKRGLWRGKDPEPPWEYRKRIRKERQK